MAKSKEYTMNMTGLNGCQKGTQTLASTCNEPCSEAITRGLALCLEGVADLKSWRDDFADIFAILDREAGRNFAADLAADELFRSIDQAIDALRAYRAARLRG
jgi:hypothetical protein